MEPLPKKPRGLSNRACGALSPFFPLSCYFVGAVPDVAEPAGLFVLLAPLLLALTELFEERWCFLAALDELPVLDELELAGVDAPPAGA